MEYITFIYALLLSLAQTLLGLGVARIVASKLGCSLAMSLGQETRLVPVYWVLGLLLHLALMLLLASVGLSWALASWLPVLLVPVLFAVNAHNAANSLADIVKFGLSSALNLPFLIWLALHGYIGASLFTLHDGISTPWMNNYGDLTFHLGMINHFVSVGEFPADYHIYAGEKLSYPFFINLWTAALWWPFQSYSALQVIFLFQWIALWIAVYCMLVKPKAVYLPWILLFGGGSYVAMFERPEPFSWQLISEGFPWTTWLSTIWVTQRSALLGLAGSLAAACLVLNTFNLELSQRWRMALAGSVLALMPLAHTHYFLFTALFLGFYLLGISVRQAKSSGISISSMYSSANASGLMILVLFSLPAVVFFPFLVSKSGMASFMLGWTMPYMSPGLGSLKESFFMWAKNAPQWIVAACALWFLTRRYLALGVLAGLFVLANVIKLASWEWDQLKVFLVIFTMMLVVWRLYLESASPGLVKNLAFYCLACLLTLPGLYEAFRIARASPSFQVYTEQKIELAELIKHHVPSEAVVASPDQHNSAATLAGRTLFFGYPGTLASHNIDYQKREQIQKNLVKLRRCGELIEGASQDCPKYIIWDSSASLYWGAQNPGPGYGKIASTKDKRQHIYRRML